MAHFSRIPGKTAFDAVLVVLLVICHPSSAGERRFWTYTPPGSGQSMKLEAEFLELRGDLVVLQNSVGKKAELALATLGPEDREFVKKMSRSEQDEFIDWTDAFGNTLRVRFAGIDGQMLILATEQGATFQVPIAGLDATQQAFVQRSQQAAAANKAAAEDTARAWKKVDKGIEVATLNPEDVPDEEREVRSLMFLAQTGLLLSTTADSNALWNTRELQRQGQLDAERMDNTRTRFRSFGDAPGRLRFDCATKLIWWHGSRYTQLACWDLQTHRLLLNDCSVGEEILRLMGIPGSSASDLLDLQFSPNGKTLAVLAEDDNSGNGCKRRVCLFDVASKRLLEALGGLDSGQGTEHLRFSADGRILVGFDRDLYWCDTWDLTTKRHCVFRPRCGNFGNLIDNGNLLGGVHREAFTDGYKVVFSFFATATGNLEGKHRISGINGARCPVAAISPVGRCVATNRGPTIYLDDWANGTNIAVLSVHQSPVTFMTFSDDGSLLATGDEMGQINLWRIASVTSGTSSPPASPTTEPDAIPHRDDPGTLAGLQEGSQSRSSPQSFVGEWRVGRPTGPDFVIVLQEDSVATCSLGTNGRWQCVNGEARIHWSTGNWNIIRPEGLGYRKLFFKAGMPFDGPPADSGAAEKISGEPDASRENGRSASTKTQKTPEHNLDQRGSPDVVSASAVQQPEEGFISLFDGQSLAGWEGGGGRYVAENGILVSDFPSTAYRSRDANLYTTREYSDFILRFEYRVGHKANSGVLFRAPREGDSDGTEVQIIDNALVEAQSGTPTYYNASLPGIAVARQGYAHPPGQWNAMELTCMGREITLRLNGTPVVTGNLDQFTLRPMDGQQRTGLRRSRGRIVILGYYSQGRVEYRNLRIRELGSQAPEQGRPVGFEAPAPRRQSSRGSDDEYQPGRFDFDQLKPPGYDSGYQPGQFDFDQFRRR